MHFISLHILQDMISRFMVVYFHLTPSAVETVHKKERWMTWKTEEGRNC